MTSNIPPFKKPLVLALLGRPAPAGLSVYRPGDDLAAHFEALRSAGNPKVRAPGDGWAGPLSLAALEAAARLEGTGLVAEWFDLKEKYGSLSISVRIRPANPEAPFESAWAAASDPSKADPEAGEGAWLMAELLSMLSGMHCQRCGRPSLVSWSGGWASNLCSSCEGAPRSYGADARPCAVSSSVLCGQLHLASLYCGRVFDAAEKAARKAASESAAFAPATGDDADDSDDSDDYDFDCPYLGDPEGLQWPDPETGLEWAMQTLDPLRAAALDDLGEGRCAFHFPFNPALAEALSRRWGLDLSARLRPEIPSPLEALAVDAPEWLAEFERRAALAASGPAAPSASPSL